jgi:Stress responsive A/B Barrel Domain
LTLLPFKLDMRSLKLRSVAYFVAFLLMTFAVFSFGSAQEKPVKMLRHVVLFKFKDSSGKADVQKVVDAFRSLKTSIPQVAAFEYGTDNSPEGLANGFTHCFLVTFKSEADRDVYLPHPKHKEFVEVLKPHLDKVQVIDFWASE